MAIAQAENAAEHSKAMRQEKANARLAAAREKQAATEAAKIKATAEAAKKALEAKLEALDPSSEWVKSAKALDMGDEADDGVRLLDLHGDLLATLVLSADPEAPLLLELGQVLLGRHDHLHELHLLRAPPGTHGCPRTSGVVWRAGRRWEW